MVVAAPIPHLRVGTAVLPLPAEVVAAATRRPTVVAVAKAMAPAVVVVTVRAAGAEATVPVVVAATAADIVKLALLVSPTTGAAAGTSTQPATAPAFLP
jgi:hypothetical protein